MPSKAKSSSNPHSQVLLVDGHKAGLKARCMLLEEAGHHATGVPSPDEALELLRSRTFDIIVTEYKFASANGTEFIAKLRGVAAGVPVILISGLVDVLGLSERTTGADAVLMKGASEPRQLTHTVSRLLRMTPAQRARRPASSEPSATAPRKVLHAAPGH